MIPPAGSPGRGLTAMIRHVRLFFVIAALRPRFLQYDRTGPRASVLVRRDVVYKRAAVDGPSTVPVSIIANAWEMT